MIFRDLLILKKKKGKRRSKMKKIINDSIIRDIRILFEQEKEKNYYEHK